MRTSLILFGVVILILLVYFFAIPYKIQRVCFGDVCPQNGAVYLLYKANLTKEECVAKGAFPVEGIGWVPVYAGCSPFEQALWK